MLCTRCLSSEIKKEGNYFTCQRCEYSTINGSITEKAMKTPRPVQKISTAYTYKSFVTNVVDGDTFDATVDLGYRLSANIRFRVKNYDAPESFRPKDDFELKRGLAAKKAATDFLLQRTVLILSSKEAVYNRWEATVTLPDGRDYATAMTELGHVKS